MMNAVMFKNRFEFLLSKPIQCRAIVLLAAFAFVVPLFSHASFVDNTNKTFVKGKAFYRPAHGSVYVAGGNIRFYGTQTMFYPVSPSFAQACFIGVKITDLSDTNPNIDMTLPNIQGTFEKNGSYWNCAWDYTMAISPAMTLGNKLAFVEVSYRQCSTCPGINVGNFGEHILIGATPSSNTVPELYFIADNDAVPQNSTTKLRWVSFNATSCMASTVWNGGSGSNAWSGSRLTSGSENSPAISNYVTFRLTCVGSSSVTKQINIMLRTPISADIKVNGQDGPIFISPGSSVNFSWCGSSATACSGAANCAVEPANNGGNFPLWGGTSGSQSAAITSPSTYLLNCYILYTAGFPTITDSWDNRDSVVINIDATLPSAPSSLIATAASCSQINLNWTGSTDVGGSGLKEYIIYRGGVEIARTTGTSYSNTGLSGNTAYSYSVKAVDNAGNISGTSNTASATTPVCVTTPTVTSPTATSIAATSATLGANVTSNGGVALTARGTCWGASSNPTVNCLAEGSTSTGIFSHNRTGLPSATTIYYRGYATNVVGTAYSPDGSFITSSGDTTVPTTSANGTAPPGGSAYSFGLWTNQNVGVTLSCSDGSGSGCASGYPKYCTDTINTCTPATAYSGRVDISTLGTSYIRFYSSDNAGNTESIRWRTILIDKTLPTNPSNLTATAVSCSQIDLSWTSSTDTGGSGLKEYIIYRGGAEIARTNGTSYSNTGLSASTAYSYYVKAVDNAGNISGASNTASATTPSCGGSLSVTSVNPSSGPTAGGTNITITGTGFSNGTAGFWHMDETSGTSVADSSGNNNTAIANGATIVAGKYGNARSFNGSSNTVTVPLATNPTVYTIAAWVKPSAAGSGSIIVRTSSCDPTCAWSHQLRLTSTGRFEHYAYDGGLKSVIGSTVVVPGQWYFVVGTAQNGGIMRLYVNGNEEGTPVSLGTLWTGGDRYVLGSNSGGGINYFNGTLDETRIYNRALSASEISALYASNADTSMTASFGGSNVSPTFTNSTQLSASTPAHAAGAVSVGITNFDGASASRADSYTYIEPIPPSQCNDTLDNDGDGKIDFGTGPGNDAGCSSSSDDSEGSNNLTLSASPVLLTATVVGGSSALATSSATFVTITPQAGFPPGSPVTLVLDKSASHAVAQNLVSRFVRAGAIMPEVTLTFSDPPTPQSAVFRLGVPHNTVLGIYEPIVVRAKDTDKTTSITLRAQDPSGNTGER